jgi:hypothetical protein
LLQGFPLFCHMPVALQFWGCWPLHCVWPGPQDPVHAPLTHVELVLQVTEPPHVPVVSHVSTPLPDAEQRVAPGVQLPWHAPLTHAWLVQGIGALQVPVVLQVSTPLLTQRVAPGVQVPAQALLTHAWLVHETAAAQLPVESQVWVAALPEHRTAPGTHTPEQAPIEHT